MNNTLKELCSDLCEAVFKDEAPREEGFDISGGMLGRHLSSWLTDVAEKIDLLQKQRDDLLAENASLCRQIKAKNEWVDAAKEAIARM